MEVLLELLVLQAKQVLSYCLSFQLHQHNEQSIQLTPIEVGFISLNDPISPINLSYNKREHSKHILIIQHPPQPLNNNL